MIFDNFPWQYCVSWIFNQPILNDRAKVPVVIMIQVKSLLVPLRRLWVVCSHASLAEIPPSPPRSLRPGCETTCIFLGQLLLEIDIIYIYIDVNHAEVTISGKVCHFCFFHVKLEACFDALSSLEIFRSNYSDLTRVFHPQDIAEAGKSPKISGKSIGWWNY